MTLGKIRVIKSDTKETDALRLNDLARIHNLPFKKAGTKYIFEDFTAGGLRQALGFAEGYDRATSHWKAQTQD